MVLGILGGIPKRFARILTTLKTILLSIAQSIADLTDGKKTYLVGSAITVGNTLVALGVVKVPLDWAALANLMLGILVCIARALVRKPVELAK